jgi:hypothetical protein
LCAAIFSSQLLRWTPAANQQYHSSFASLDVDQTSFIKPPAFGVAHDTVPAQKLLCRNFFLFRVISLLVGVAILRSQHLRRALILTERKEHNEF